MLPGLALAYDFFNLITKIDIRKAGNAWNIYRSYLASKKYGIPEMIGMPFAISIEPTTSCNLRCSQCPSGLRSFTRPTGMLTNPLFEKIIDELESTLIYLTFYFQGEPYLNPDFLQMISYASNKRIYISTSTNAHYLSPENAELTVRSGLSRIIISLDGTNQQTYEKYRTGGDYDKVVSGIKNLIKSRKKLKSKTPFIILQFIVFQHNEHELPLIKKLASSLGVDELQIKKAQVYDQDLHKELIPLNKKYNRYNTDSLPNIATNHCWKMWHSAVITWDGKVVPCCFDKDASHQVGDIINTSFAAIWHGDLYNNFRKSLFYSRKGIDICSNCSEGLNVYV